MVDDQERSRPYAATANVRAVLDRVRTRNLPEIINSDFLRIAGIPEVVFGRVMQALRFLKLVYEDGRPAETLRAISGAPEAQYRNLLEKVVHEAYQDDLSAIDPGQDPQSRIIDAFRRYQPRSQTSRMVMLFLGLCREAGIPVLDAPRERRMKETRTRQTRVVPPRDRAPAQRGDVSSQLVGRVPLGGAIAEPLFRVTEEDIAFLDEAEFKEVWTALGKVARARARARTQQTEEQPDRPQIETEERQD